MAAAFAREGGYGAPASVINVDSSHPDHAIIVPDAQLLFTADFHRSGPDLILIGRDGRHHIIPDYFATEHRATLAAPNGARLSPDLIDLLAGSPTPNEYAQAGPPTPADPIGEVEKVVGTVTVIRNGVSVALNVGDKVYKSDVVQTGADSQLGISFPDGTALNLVANTRMALNDYSYDPNSTSNGAVISLVEGTFSFVAGKVAHSGNMKIDTPVATMGIRGTTGWVAEVTATVGNQTYTFAVVADQGTNQSGIYDLIDQSGNVIATVSQTGYVTTVAPQGVGQSPSVTTQPITAAQLQFEQQIIQQVFDTVNLGNNANPHTNPNGGSSSPPSPLNNILEQLVHENGSTVNVNLNTGGNSGTTTTATVDITTVFENLPTAVAYWVNLLGGNWFIAGNWSDDYVPLLWQSIVIDPTELVNNVPEPVQVTVTIDASGGLNTDGTPVGAVAAELLVGPDATVDIVTGGSLTVSNNVYVFGIIKVDSTGGDPTFTAQGPVTIYNGATVEALGSNAMVFFSADTVDNSGTILAEQGGAIYFQGATVQQAAVTNEAAGQIEADAGGTIFLQGSTVIGGTLLIEFCFRFVCGGADRRHRQQRHRRRHRRQFRLHYN